MKEDIAKQTLKSLCKFDAVISTFLGGGGSERIKAKKNRVN
jgi:hypothetical protein